MTDDTLVIALLVGACAFLVIVFIIIPALTARQHDPYDPPAPYNPPGEGSPFDVYITPDKSAEQLAQEKAEREERQRLYREYYNGENPAYWARAEMQARAEQGGWRGWGE